MSSDLHAALRAYARDGWLGAVLGAAGILFASGAAVILMAVLLPAGGPPSAAQRALVLSLCLFGSAGAVVFLVQRWRRGLRHPMGLARAIEDAMPDVGDRVRSAVGLDLDPAERASALARAHVAGTRELLGLPAVRVRYRRAVLAQVRLLGWCGVAGALTMAGTWAWSPGRVSTGLARIFTGTPGGAQARAAALPPLWTDVSVELSFPAYMNRAPLTLEGITGDITAPRGTEVLIRARADRAVRSARLLLPSGEVALTVKPPRGLEGRFTVSTGGQYRVALVEAGGSEVIEEAGHALVVETDDPPQVELVEPAKDDTVQQNASLPLVFQARDDHGLTTLAVVVRNLRGNTEPVRKPLASPRADAREHSGRGTLDLAALRVRPGDRLSVQVEARDNDTVGGPKAGLSAPRILRVFSPSEHHAELVAKQEEMLRRMVTQLGDEMETPLRTLPDSGGAADAEAQRFQLQVQRGQSVVEDLGKLAAQFTRDELAPIEVARALRNMKTDLGRHYDEMGTLGAELVNQARASARLVEPWASRLRKLGQQVATRLETHILYMEDLVGRQRLQDAHETARELADTQQRLRELMQQYKKAGDDETRAQILREMEQLRAQLADLQRKLAEMQRELPQEYVNMDAMQQQDLSSPMDDIDRMLAEGDIEGAMRKLDEMAERTRKLLDEMQKGEKEYGGDQYAELGKKLQAFKEELDQVAKEQEDLLQESRATMQKAQERARKKLGEDVEALAARLEKEALALKESLRTMAPRGLSGTEAEQRDDAESRAGDAARALKAQDFDEAQRSVGQVVGSLEWLRVSLADRTEGPFAVSSREARKARDQADALLPRARKLQEELDKLAPDPSEHMTEQDRAALRENAKRQGKLAERARQLGQDMGNIDKEAPVFGSEHREAMEGARRDMQGAQADLGVQDVPGAAGRQQQAVGRMQELKRALAEMAQNAGGGGGGGIPLPFAQGEDRQRREGNGRSGSHERVEIPGADQYTVPPQFRRDILDAMKEGAPGRFRDEVKRYYEELVK